VTGRILGWWLGQRTDATLQEFLDWIGIAGRRFVTDDWAGFHRLIPEDRLYTGKDLTSKVESSNSDVRHHVARFTRRCKVHSRSQHMVDLSLRLAAHLRVTENYNKFRDVALSIFK
jgi:insertion element IS1 protein InsB